jgi:DNA-binding transcriptional LysR family regulator
VLAATRADLGIAILPRYVAREALDRDEIVPLLESCRLPSQEVHAVYPSPKLVSAKVLTLAGYLAERLAGEWWRTKPG